MAMNIQQPLCTRVCAFGAGFLALSHQVGVSCFVAHFCWDNGSVWGNSCRVTSLLPVFPTALQEKLWLVHGRCHQMALLHWFFPIPNFCCCCLFGFYERANVQDGRATLRSGIQPAALVHRDLFWVVENLGNLDVLQELAMLLGWNSWQKWPYKPQNFSVWVSLLSGGTQYTKKNSIYDLSLKFCVTLGTGHRWQKRPIILERDIKLSPNITQC